MIRATRVLVSGEATDAPTDSIELDFHHRHRRRLAMTSDSGREFLLDLESAIALSDGDRLLLEDGTVVVVRAKPEPVADLFPGASMTLAQLAWHLGNRHVRTQILVDRLRIGQDHVIEDMAEGLGARIERIEAPFQPESGAYAHEH